MADLLESVIEEDKQHKTNRYVKLYSKIFVAFLSLFVLCIVIFSWWRSHQLNVLQQESTEYYKVLQSAKSVSDQMGFTEFSAKMELLTRGKTVYKTMASLRAAQMYFDMKNYAQAAHFYKIAMDDHDSDKGLRSFATLMHMISLLNGAKLTNQEALTECESMLKNGNIFQGVVKVLKASVLLQMGKKDEAAILLQGERESFLAHKSKSGYAPYNEGMMSFLYDILLINTVR